MKRIFCVWALLTFFALPGAAFPANDTTSLGNEAATGYVLKMVVLDAGHGGKDVAVYIETGFVSNPNERQFLNSREGQMKLARSIFNAFESYKANMESAD